MFVSGLRDPELSGCRVSQQEDGDSGCQQLEFHILKAGQFGFFLQHFRRRKRLDAGRQISIGPL